MKRILSLAMVLISLHAMAQTGDARTIINKLELQADYWNKGDLVKFMEGYWNNDSLMFIGSNGVTYGYKNTLENYKKSYPDTAAMGKLHFDFVQVKQVAPEYYYVVGKWYLKRSIGDVSGHFTLLWKKINGQWLCISDHSS
jgi:ketosteroid isomerase-like protein